MVMYIVFCLVFSFFNFFNFGFYNMVPNVAPFWDLPANTLLGHVVCSTDANINDYLQARGRA